MTPIFGRDCTGDGWHGPAGERLRASGDNEVGRAGPWSFPLCGTWPCQPARPADVGAPAAAWTMPPALTICQGSGNV